MSRIGKMPIAIPQGTKVALNGKQISVQGPKGSLIRDLNPQVSVAVQADQIVVSPGSGSNNDRAMQGLTRSLINNMVIGVTRGFEKVLEISGVGYRAEVKGTTLSLALGYSHQVDYQLPQGISAVVEKQTKITVSGVDCELVGAAAAKIRSFRKPEPYKGKGIKYASERILRKAGKTGK